VKNPALGEPEFLDRQALDRELTRVFEKCQDCRRCLPLCPSFPSLFASVDRHEQQAAELTAREIREVIDLCYQCKLCYNHCPYHPPHDWMIDFPKLMSRAKLVQTREEGIPLAERMGQKQDLLGKLGCLSAPLTNAAFKNRAVRLLMEKGTGIDRRWLMPHYERSRFSRQVKGHRPGPGPNGRVLLFPTCFVEYSDAETGQAALQVLEHNGVAVETDYEACCGAPFLHGGDLAAARRNAEKVVRALAPRVREGVAVLVPGPTCSYQIKHEYPELLDNSEARLVAENAYDICEYLWKLKQEDKLRTDFPKALGKVAYHLPCHLKAQNIGFRSRQLLKLAGAEVEMLDHCSGVDGTWGMQQRWYAQSLEVACKLLDEIKRLEPDHVSSDCPLAALRILEGTGRRALHPIALLRDAYGLEAKA
jgi:Fe-S oxidoreductase